MKPETAEQKPEGEQKPEEKKKPETLGQKPEEKPGTETGAGGQKTEGGGKPEETRTGRGRWLPTLIAAGLILAALAAAALRRKRK